MSYRIKTIAYDRKLNTVNPNEPVDIEELMNVVTSTCYRDFDFGVSSMIGRSCTSLSLSSVFGFMYSLRSEASSVPGKYQGRRSAHRTIDEFERSKSKLAGDFVAALLDLQKAQKLAMKREDARNASPSRPWPLTSSPSEETAAGEDAGDDDRLLLLWEQTRQELLSLENEIVFNEAIIEESEKDIKEIHYDVQKIHEIYQDLAVLLHDQPISIDNIDKRIEESAASTGRAKEQLYKASKCSRSRSSWVSLGVLGVDNFGAGAGHRSPCSHLAPVACPT
ncbi:syntaxin-22-like isoform X3 [Musa acuminata AAA Group]|uniref:syntaxin-22-like isoform X3 n=1 Tax=Musa acuminata AAA Group TaxID=214697 RepID=UPI0031D7377E